MKRAVLAYCLVLSALSASWLPASETLEKIQSMLAKPSVLCGRFDQNKRLTGLKKPLISRGRFCVVADKGVLWRTLHPVASTLRITRDEIIQLEGDRIIIRRDAKSEPTVRVINSLMFALLGGDFAKLDTLFEVDGGIRDKNWSLQLKAREPGLSKAIDGIALDGDAHVKSITILEASGDRTTIVFSEIQTEDRAMGADEAALF